MNHIKIVDDVAKEMRLGWPKGTFHAYKIIPVLLTRILELEAAVAPFARVAVTERSVANPPPLVHVYLKDCIKAFDAVDPAQTKMEKVDDFFSQPAE